MPDKNLIYFIVSNPLEEPIKIQLSEKEDEAGELKTVLTKIHEVDERLKYKFKIYRFEIYPSKINIKEKKKPEFSIKWINKKENTFEGKITVQDISRNFSFIYDFKFNSNRDCDVIIDPPKSIKFNHMEQFEIYLDYIKTVVKKNEQSEQEIKDLCFSTQNLFIDSAL